jgi:hypothetical protein
MRETYRYLRDCGFKELDPYSFKAGKASDVV